MRGPRDHSRSRRLFGTDGIRGVAGEFPLDPATVYSTGVALGELAGRLDPRPEVVLGMDTRESGPGLAAQMAGGLARGGVRARFAGVITTPGIAYLTRTHSFVAGVMISASHNPYQDNGIKVFAHSGYKLDDEQEHGLEQRIFAGLEAGLEVTPHQPLEAEAALPAHYLHYLASILPGSLAGMRLMLDCGHGAASELAPRLFERLGAEVEAIANAPDGRNINAGCGALHPELVRELVLARGADLGVSFDGDADRAIFVSQTGRVVDGDGVLLVAARWLLRHGRLGGPGGEPLVVATVMSNLGLERALQALGVRLLRVPVGDRYVLEGMLRTGAVLGGEQSGHVIFHEYSTTGDGLLTALRVLEIMRETGAGLDELLAGMEVYPQRLLNVRVRERRPLAELPGVAAAIRAAETFFGSHGRVLVRFSGTEPLARVMVEGPEMAKVHEHSARIAEAIRRELGG
ncbi:MAG: phosphoglucosamine mutase [Acidobacteria bacterium]|nr:phosphoglucosamine mutase [Acidobacteriota bacterium]